MVHRLTRGRLWIGLLATLLVGIVGLNVMALSFSASSSKAGRAAVELERQNSALRAQLASQLSSEELQRTASRLGLIVPEPGAIGYLEPGADDAAVAAKRLRDGELTFADAATTPVTAVAPDPAVASDPAVAAAEPATVGSEAAAPVAESVDTAAAPAEVATGTASAPPSGAATAPAGGVSSP
jgi:hypothetical protein